MHTRRFWIATLAGSLAATCFAASVVTAQQPQAPQKQYVAILEATHMCCAKESVPAIKELSKLQGIGKISVDYKKHRLLIEPKEVQPSARAIWEAAERVAIGPVKLTMASGVYTSKPQR